MKKYITTLALALLSSILTLSVEQMTNGSDGETSEMQETLDVAIDKKSTKSELQEK